MASSFIQPISPVTPLLSLSLPPKPVSSSPPPPPSSCLSLSNSNPFQRLRSTSAPILSPLPQPSSLLHSQGFLPSHPLDDSASPESTDSLGDDCFDLLRLAVRYDDLELAKAVHALVLKLDEDASLGNALIVAYLKLGRLPDAYGVFNGLSRPNVVSFTALVSGFAKSGRECDAVELFFRMRSSGIEPNEYSYVAILTACVRLLELELGLQVHALVIKMGYLGSVFVSNALMGLYSKCERLVSVLQLFDEMPGRDIASWNTVISSLVKAGMHERVFEYFRAMQQSDCFRVDYMTVSSLLTACTDICAWRKGREIHAHAIRTCVESNLSLNNGLIGFYAKCGNINNVEALFARMATVDVITWTQMIKAYAEFGLVDMALEVFHKMPEKNSVSHNTLLEGLCENGEALRVLDLFIGMVKEGTELTEFTLTIAAKACGFLAERTTSEQLHGFIIKFGLESNPFVDAALLDMCTRCGRMADAGKIFTRSGFESDNSIMCTSMICGHARNGRPDEALSLFCHCQREGTVILDEVASTSVLGICGTLGYDKMGEQIHCHVIKSGITSDLEVANALISMYSKCWNLDAANELFQIMPVRDVVSWNGLIAGYILHRRGDGALAIWSNLKEAGMKPDKITILLVISAYRYTKSCLVDECRRFFFSATKEYGVEPLQEHYASLVSVLGFWGFLELAEETIGSMPFEPEAVVWRAMLDGCRLHSKMILGKRVIKHLLSVEPQDPSTYVLVSNLYSASGRWDRSETVRMEMREKGFRKHPSRSWFIHQNEIVSFYTRDKSHSQTKDIYSGLEILILECLKAGYVPDTSFVLHEVEEHQKEQFLFYHSAKLASAFGLLITRLGKPVRIVKNVMLCGDCHQFLKYASAVTKREILLRDASGFHHFSGGRCSCNDRW